MATKSMYLVSVIFSQFLEIAPVSTGLFSMPITMSACATFLKPWMKAIAHNSATSALVGALFFAAVCVHYQPQA